VSFLVVIEGLDRTGKSTLAYQLSRETGARVTHFSKPAKEPVFEYTDPLVDHTHSSKQVFDRYHVGELVWPTIFGRPSTFGPAQQTYVEMALQSRGAVIVKTSRDMDDLREHLIRDDEPLDPDKAEFADALFLQALAGTEGTPVLSWSLGQPLAYIMEAALQRGSAMHTGVLDISERVVGCTDCPALMIVCDSPTLLPMVPGISFPDSKYLISELMFFEGMAQEVLLVSHQAPLDQVWEEVFAPPVVALGRNASAALEKHKVPHESVTSPDVARSTNAHVGPGAYGEAIRRRIR
jgi:hypothetical protein